MLTGQQAHQLPAVWTSVRAKPVMLAAHAKKLQPAQTCKGLSLFVDCKGEHVCNATTGSTGTSLAQSV